jgi:hypothetical protein
MSVNVRCAGRARVVHFATHCLVTGETAIFAANHAEPALLSTPPETASAEDDGLLTASEVALLKESPRMPACWASR